jgi:hypothetical protein
MDLIAERTAAELQLVIVAAVTERTAKTGLPVEAVTAGAFPAAAGNFCGCNKSGVVCVWHFELIEINLNGPGLLLGEIKTKSSPRIGDAEIQGADAGIRRKADAVARAEIKHDLTFIVFLFNFMVDQKIHHGLVAGDKLIGRFEKSMAGVGRHFVNDVSRRITAQVFTPAGFRGRQLWRGKQKNRYHQFKIHEFPQ